jgi:hypothetical protein
LNEFQENKKEQLNEIRYARCERGIYLLEILKKNQTLEMKSSTSQTQFFNQIGKY